MRTRFPGWHVVGGAFVLMMTSAGFGFYGLPLYLSTLNEVKGFSVSTMSGATAVFFLTNGLAGVLVAHLLRRFDPRPIIVVGSFLAAAALVALGRLTAAWQVYPTYIVFAIGFALSGLLISNTIVARWFNVKRSVALSVASSGLSVGGIVMIPIARHLLDANSLRTATAWIAGLYLLGAIPLPLLLLRPDPSRLGWGPDGVRLSAATSTTEAEMALKRAPSVMFADAIRTPAYWAITVGFALGLSAQVGGLAQLVKLGTERVDRDTGAFAVQVVAFCSVVGRLTGGLLVTKIRARTFTLGCLAVQSVGLLALGWADGRTKLLWAAVLFGLMVGNVLLLHPLLLADLFGVGDYPRILSRSSLYVAFGTALGPFLLGWLRDHGGGYRTSYAVAGTLSVLGAVVYARGTTPRPGSSAPGSSIVDPDGGAVGDGSHQVVGVGHRDADAPM